MFHIVLVGKFDSYFSEFAKKQNPLGTTVSSSCFLLPMVFVGPPTSSKSRWRASSFALDDVCSASETIRDRLSSKAVHLLITKELPSTVISMCGCKLQIVLEHAPIKNSRATRYICLEAQQLLLFFNPKLFSPSSKAKNPDHPQLLRVLGLAKTKNKSHKVLQKASKCF